MDNVVETVAEGAAKVADKVRDVAGKVAAEISPAALPDDRPSLLALHRAARRRRDSAPLMSHERAQAAYELERIEVHIAAVERAMDPPLV
jgi:hypothetical protein